LACGPKQHDTLMFIGRCGLSFVIRHLAFVVRH
jgi:hypothetical protein